MNAFLPRLIPAFDQVVEHFIQQSTSFSEEGALQEKFWDRGEEGRLREDFRFRQTPGGRWIISHHLLANDELRKLFTRKHRSSLPFSAALAELGPIGERAWVFCSADKRFVLEGENLRLSEQELSDSLLAEDALELEKYVSHLPIRNLEAVAASEPEGEWGPSAQEDMGDVLGWVRVNMPGVVLNDRMFVARIKGQSMDDGRLGIVDGSYSLFELWPAGTRQGKIILVRGAFHDPETGSYAVKKYIADQRNEEGRHNRIALVSLNPDKEKYPDIALDPDDDQAVVVIAEHVESLSGHQYGREPKPVKPKGSGRRNLTPEYVKGRLLKRKEQIFGSRGVRPDREEQEKVLSRFICLDFESGGLHIETDPLTWLPNFVKKVNLCVGGKEQSVILASNLKNLSWRQTASPSRDEYSFHAPGFEEDIGDDLGPLALGGLSYDSGTVFKVDANGIGRLQKNRTLTPGQEYRLLIPPVLRIDSVLVGECSSFISGWQLWDFVLPVEVELPLREQLLTLQLTLGKYIPQIRWSVFPPVDYQQTHRGETLPCFQLSQQPIIKVNGKVNIAGEMTLFVMAGGQVTSLRLPPGNEWLFQLEDLPVGPVILQLLHKKTNVAPVTVPFYVVDKAAKPVCAEISVELKEKHCAVGGTGAFDLHYDVSDVVEDDLKIYGPPLWPMHSSWTGNTTSELTQTYLTRIGGFDPDPLLNKTKQLRESSIPGNWIFDFAELGQIRILHGGNPDPDVLREQFITLAKEREQSLPGLVGQYLLLKQVWIEPVLKLMGLECEELSFEELEMAPQGMTAMLLSRTVRHFDNSITRERHSLFVLVTNHAEITRKGEGSSWEYADKLCTKYDLPMATISDGLTWMRHRRASKMKGTEFPLLEIIKQDNDDSFEPFLSECGGW